MQGNIICKCDLARTSNLSQSSEKKTKPVASYVLVLFGLWHCICVNFVRPSMISYKVFLEMVYVVGMQSEQWDARLREL